MLNGLDLFSGYGGTQDALRGLVRPIAYCEIEQGAKRILLQRMRKGHIGAAPIWDDVRTLQRRHIAAKIDIITGGFPCTDLSVAGRKAGLDGKRSGLFFEIIRLVREFRPSFVYMENVTGIFSGDAFERVAAEISAIRYDCRWGVLSAYDVGACHYRERVWILCADTARFGIWAQRISKFNEQASRIKSISTEWNAPNASLARLARAYGQECFGKTKLTKPAGYGEWTSQPGICRGIDGPADRRDRIRALGNGWVPQTAREAFKRLIGFK